MNALASELLNDTVNRGDPSTDDIRGWIVAQLAAILSVSAESIDTSAPLHSLGASSLVALIAGPGARHVERLRPTLLRS